MNTPNDNPAPETSPEIHDNLRPEYDADLLKNPVRGKHLAKYRAGINLVLLAPDVAAAFPTEQAVNDALRRLIQTLPK